MLVPAFGVVVSGHVGYDFGQVGRIDGHAGVIHQYSRFAGAYPPNMCSKGGILITRCAPRSR